MNIKRLYWILAASVLLTIAHIIAIYANAHFNLNFSLLGTPQKEHLTIVSLCASTASFLVASYTLLTKGDSKLGGEVVRLINNEADIVFYNEADKRELITSITLSRIGREKPSPLALELPKDIMPLEKHNYVTIKFSPPDNYKFSYRLVKLRAKVTLLNGNELEFDLKDGIRAD